MDKHIAAEEKRIRRMGASRALDSIDVKASVMKRVRAIHAQQIAAQDDAPASLEQPVSGMDAQTPVMIRQQMPPQRPAPRRGRRMAAGLCAMAMLGLASFGVLRYAEDQGTMGKAAFPDFAVIRQTEGKPLVLKDSGGRIVAQLKNAESKVNTPSYTGSASARERYYKLREQYEHQAQADLQPGETAAYYVNDSELIALMNGLGYGKPLFFTSRTVTYTNYAKLSAAREQTGKWSFGLPPERIGGFQFTGGRLFTKVPSSFEPEYGLALEALKAGVEGNPGGNPLAATLWPMKDIASAELDYREGGEQLKLNILWNNTATTGPVQIFLNDGHTAELWSYANQELLFIPGTGDVNNGGSVSRLYWYDSAYGGLALITDPPNQRLTREQWETIAAGMVQQ